MVHPKELFTAVEECVQTSTRLAGKKVLVSAGSTKEYLDPVRYLSNRSSGKMGIALAREALRQGAEVSLVLGSANEAAPVNERLRRIDVTSADDMHQAMLGEASDADIIICAAAVADYRPAQRATTKIKKQEEQQSIELIQTPDILAELGQMKADGKLKDDLTLVGFAAETDNIEDNVRTKLQHKGADFIIANDVSRTDIGFESTDNEVRIFSKDMPKVDQLIPKTSKTQLAHQILDAVVLN